MRTRNKAFLSCAILAGVLLAATGVMAADPSPPTSCTTTNGWNVQAEGPTQVTCVDDPNAQCTEIVYAVTHDDITAPPDHVFTLVRAEAELTEPPADSSSVFPVCVGDNVTQVGLFACHEVAVRLNEEGTTRRFHVQARGNRAPLATSVVVKKGRRSVGSCAIVGVGLEGLSPFQNIQTVETVTFKECTVNFFFNALTGEFEDAELAEGSESCDFFETTVDKLDLALNVPVGTCTTPPCDLGIGQFGEGYVATGDGSCTTRVIGGRVYTWGRPCP